jgi:hypothetical protein
MIKHLFYTFFIYLVKKYELIIYGVSQNKKTIFNFFSKLVKYFKI